MLGKGMVALGRVVLSKRERVIMLQPRGKGLLGATLRYPYEVRDEAIYFGDIGDIQIPKDMLALAEHILESKAATFDPTLFHDRYEEAVVAHAEREESGDADPQTAPDAKDCRGHRSDGRAEAEHRKGEGRNAEVAPPNKRAPAVPAAKLAAAAKSKRNVKGSSDQREMLLPIAGGAPAKEAGAAAKGAPEKQTAQKPGSRKKAG